MTNKYERIKMRGTAVYPRLNKADIKYFSRGEFKTSLRMSEEEAKPLMSRLSEIFQDHTGEKINKNKTNLWTFDVDDQGEPAGTVTFHTKIRNLLLKKSKKGKDGKKVEDFEIWERKPKQYDSQGNLIDVQVGAGSELIVACDIYAWDTGSNKGITLQPIAVQVIKLVEYVEKHGFDAVEGGFIGKPDTDNSDTVVEAVAADDFDF